MMYFRFNIAIAYFVFILHFSPQKLVSCFFVSFYPTYVWASHLEYLIYSNCLLVVCVLAVIYLAMMILKDSPNGK